MIAIAVLVISALCIIPITTFYGLYKSWASMPVDRRTDPRHAQVLQALRSRIRRYFTIWIISLVVLAFAYFTR